MKLIDKDVLARMHWEATSCEWCSEVPAVHCHHIRPRGHGGGSRLDVAFNLVMLCVACHEKAQANRIPQSVLWGLAAEREVRRLLRMDRRDYAKEVRELLRVLDAA